MKRLKYLLTVIPLLLCLLLTGCLEGEEVQVDDTPSINVNVTGGSVTATVPNPLPVSGTVTANVSPNPLPVNVNGVTVNDGCIPVAPYYYQIADGKIAGHTPWTLAGYTAALGTVESDIWSAGGTIPFPTVAQQMQVLSSNNVDDIGTAIFSGNSSGGSTTTLVDVTKNFTAGTPVVAGDVILLDTTKEYGFITGVAATTLTISDGFSLGGSGESQAYRVIDDSPTLGAHVVAIEYLDASYNTQWEFVILNGTTAVNTVTNSIYRVNSFRVIATGGNKKPTGNITLRNTAGTTTYNYITAGYTRARVAAYTIPSGYTLFVTSVTFSYGYASNSTQFSRIYTRATQNNNFRTDGIFYPFTEVVCANSSIQVDLALPTKLLEKIDLKVSGVSTFTGTGDVTLRGWLELK